MFNRQVYFLALFLVVLCGCQSSEMEVSFADVVLPLLNKHCAVCHMGDGAQAGFSLYPSPYQKLVGIKSVQSPLALVEPGSSSSSYLYHKMIGTQDKVNGSGSNMPYQRDLLSEMDISTIRQWIDDGAKDN